MDWERYKQICHEPNVFSRWMLEQTAELLEPDLARLLREALGGSHITRPDGHQGHAATHMFALALSAGQVAAILASVDAAVRAGRTTSATRERGLGGFREAWAEYLDALGRERERVP